MSIKTKHLTLPILALNSLVDAGKSLTVDEAHRHIDAGDLFQEVERRFGKHPGLEVLWLDHNRSELAQLTEALQRYANACSAEADFGIQRNGLIYVVALINEMVQQSSETIDVK